MYDFILVFDCNYVSILRHFRELSLIAENLKTTRNRDHITQGTVFNPNAKTITWRTSVQNLFEVSSFSRSIDILGGL